MMWGQQIDHSSRLGVPRRISLGRCQFKKLQEGVSGIGLFQFLLFAPGRNDEGLKIQFNALRDEEILRACDPVEPAV